MRAYNIDLRKKVISFIQKGNSQKLATQVFDLNKATVNRWWIRYKTQGHFKPYKIGGSKGKIDLKYLQKLVAKDCNITLAKLAQVFKVSLAAISQRLKQLGYSYKKNVHLLGSVS